MHKYDWNIAGHEDQRLIIESDINQNNIATAYLFTGPKKIGKFKFARTFANILLCKKGLCGECVTCKQIDKGECPSVIEFKDNSDKITIVEMRELVRKTSLNSGGELKIILIEDIERIQREANHTILKPLEEPGENYLFLFTTNKPELILDTIKSRCRTVNFNTVSDAKLLSFLTKKNIQFEQAKLNDALRFSFGSPGEFFALLQDDNLLNEKKELYQKVLKTIENPFFPNVVSLTKNITENDEIKDDVFELFINIIRTKLLDGCEKHLDQNEINKLLEIAKSLALTISHCKNNVNAKLAIENLFLQCKQLV